MYKKLSDAKLKTGENMEIGVVIAPDEEYAERVINILKHKGEPWMSHIEKALKGEITELETRFYIGHLHGQVIANVMTAEYNQTGIFGHVFTRPEQRRKWACNLIISHQMEDFKKRGGGLLILGTGYNSPAYWIYHSHGFRSFSEGSGSMRFSTEDDFEKRHFTHGKVKAVDVEWRHWPLMNVLTSVRGIEVFRSLTLNLYGFSNSSGGILNFIKRLKDDGQLKAQLLESSSGAVVGCITLERDRRWLDKTYTLDIFTHPNFISNHDVLLNAIKLPEGKIQCYVDAGSPDEKISALQQAGFEREAVLKKQFTWDGHWFDVFIYAKFN